MMLAWEAVGFNLAYKKGQLSKNVDWIGGNLQYNTAGFTSKVKESIAQDIRDDLKSLEGQNVIAKRSLQSFVGRANHAAGLLVVLRPFLQANRGAFYGDSGGAPPSTIWAKQISHAIAWLREFFNSELQNLRGVLRYWACLGDRHWREPMGHGRMAGQGLRSNKILHLPSHRRGLFIFGLERGSCEGQQTLEGLAILVAMRLWNDGENARLINLNVTGDNVGALARLIKMRSSSGQQDVIGRELAMITVKAAVPPTVSHTPGVVHELADAPSGLDEPGSKDKVMVQDNG